MESLMGIAHERMMEQLILPAPELPGCWMQLAGFDHPQRNLFAGGNPTVLFSYWPPKPSVRHANDLRMGPGISVVNAGALHES